MTTLFSIGSPTTAISSNPEMTASGSGLEPPPKQERKNQPLDPNPASRDTIHPGQFSIKIPGQLSVKINKLSFGSNSHQPGIFTNMKIRVLGFPTRQPLILGLILTIALLWPLLLGGLPGYIPDSSSYYRGGQASVMFIQAKFHGREDADKAIAHASPPNNATAIAPASSTIRGIRSIAYSILSFVLAFPGTTLISLVVFQAAAAAAMIIIFCRAHRLEGIVKTIALTFTVAGVTALPLFTTLATPDVFAGLLILGVVILVGYSSRISLAERLVVLFLVAFAVASHAGNILLGLAMCGLLAVFLVFSIAQGRVRLIGGGIAWAVAAMALGSVAAILSSLIGFHEVSVAPKRYPFALARSIEDGPARWYLEEHCAEEKYAVCELYPGEFPKGVGDFLWNSNGIQQRATPTQMDRIRSEELTIIGRALAEYPYYQLEASLRNLGTQISMMSIAPGIFHNVNLTSAGQLEPASQVASLDWHQIVQTVGVGMSLLLLPWLLWRGGLIDRTSIGLVMFGILANDAICAMISAPDIRYQSRLLWLLPLVVVTLLLRSDRDLSKGPT